MKSRWLIVIFIALCTFLLCNRLAWQKKFFEWDKNGYYIYLPATFIYHDLARFDFYDAVQQQYNLDDDEIWYIHEQPNGKKLNKYAIGTAILEMPFFLVAHSFCSFSSYYPADGYSIPYRIAVIFANFFWVIIGLFVLGKLLSNFFNDWVVAVTLACIAFGTNLFTYTVFDQGLSHPFSFFLFSAVLYANYLYYSQQYRQKHLYVIAICLGLITITRPVNILVVLIPLFWGVFNAATFKIRLQHFKHATLPIVKASFIFLAICLLQAGYWKYATGQWIYFSYEGEGFVFSDPQIWKGLFSYRKGWFIYTPIAFLSVAGLYSLGKRHKTLAPSISCFLVLMIYVTFSWYNWYYGGSFGCRPLIDILPVLALPLAALVDHVYTTGRQIVSVSLSVLLSFFILLNMFQSYQFSIGTIPVDRMNKAYYWRIFGKPAATDEDRTYWMNDKEYRQDTKEMSDKVQKKD